MKLELAQLSRFGQARIKIRKELMNRANRKWMPVAEYLRELARLGLDSSSAAELFGVSRRTAQYWASGMFPVPKAVAMALRVMKRKEPEEPAQETTFGSQSN